MKAMENKCKKVKEKYFKKVESAYKIQQRK